MPLTALLAGTVVLDATEPILADGVTWEQIHLARPRAQLTCRGCGGDLHAKQSNRGLRFFAHDSKADCPYTQESLEHRLLKAALAAAVRDAGWHAELEVAGLGATPWRADVMATSPDGARRIALEAQLSPITPTEIAERTDNYATVGVEVCWVTDRFVAWLGHVPYWMVTHPDDGPLSVELGVWKWVQEQWHDDEPGYGSWEAVALPMDRAVALLCQDQLVVQPVSGTDYVQVRGRTRYLEHPEGGQHVAWTAPAYAKAAKQNAAAWASFRAHQAEKQAAHAKAIEELAARQRALIAPTVEHVRRQTGKPAVVARKEAATDHGWDEFWAMGVPIKPEDGRWVSAVICPVASRVTPEIRARLAFVLVVVANERERERLADACDPRQRFHVMTTA